MNKVSGEWLLRENRIEAVACALPTLDHIMEGIHVVQALGHDGMTVNIAVNTEAASSDPDNSETVQMVYLARLLRNERRAEMLAA
jgi:hypothetical protein